MIHRDLFLAYVMLTKVLDSSRAIVLRGGSKTRLSLGALPSGTVPKGNFLVNTKGKETA